MPTTSPIAPIDLSGTWRCRPDTEDRGLELHWENEPTGVPVELPGDLASQGLGSPVDAQTEWTGSIFDPAWYTEARFESYRQSDNIKIPFWLQPEGRHLGPAWFYRKVELPASDASREWLLSLERVHWTSTLWVNGHPVGTQTSLSTPQRHRFEIPAGVRALDLVLRIDNRPHVPVGPNSHAISDHTQGNWNGVIGELSLLPVEESPPRIELYPNFSDNTLLVRLPEADPRANYRVLAFGNCVAAGPSAQGGLEAKLGFGEAAERWDEFKPVLHTLQILRNGEPCLEQRVGLREVCVQGRRILVNGRHLFLRGTLDCAAFPATGTPPTDLESWLRLFGIIKGHGLNHVRFHSWCPPKAAFLAADQLGLYLQIEAPTWPNQGATVGDGRPNDAWTVEESLRILKEYGNHPSFLLMASGNEPDGPAMHGWLAKWLQTMRAQDPRRLYSSAAGWPEMKESDYHILHQPRLHQWLDNLRSRINAQPPETCSDFSTFIQGRAEPVISHEIGQWCAYPDLSEIEQHTGLLRARNFEIVAETLEASGMTPLAKAFLLASGALQKLCYKEEIESALRTPEMAGFQLLSLQDFPGQGTALVGLLNCFWQSKGYVTPEEFRRFCGPSVLLARLPSRILCSGQSLEISCELRHAAPTPSEPCLTHWSLRSNTNTVVAAGTFPGLRPEQGSLSKVGTLTLEAPACETPAKYTLRLETPALETSNEWSLWVFPRFKHETEPDTLRTFTQVDTACLAHLEAGGTVLLELNAMTVAAPLSGPPVALGFSSIFWNTSWTNGQAPHTLGILCEPTHPALRDFPTESHSDWQWWYVLQGAGALPLDRLPKGLQPLVRIIDDWNTNRPLALLLEARVGKGRLLVTGAALQEATDPVRRQLRSSLLRYCASPEFRPQTEISVDELRSLIGDTAQN